MKRRWEAAKKVCIRRSNKKLRSPHWLSTENKSRGNGRGMIPHKICRGHSRPRAMKGQMTMKTYQAILPMTTRRLKRSRRCRTAPRLQTTDQLAHQIQRSVETVLMAGFWFCHDCDCICERIEASKAARALPPLPQPAHRVEPADRPGASERRAYE